MHPSHKGRLQKPWCQCQSRSPSLTIAVLLPLAPFLLVALITRAGSVQAPVQDVTQQPFLLQGQFSCGRGHKAGSVGLHGIIPSPLGESRQSR